MLKCLHEWNFSHSTKFRAVGGRNGFLLSLTDRKSCHLNRSFLFYSTLTIKEIFTFDRRDKKKTLKNAQKSIFFKQCLSGQTTSICHKMEYFLITSIYRSIITIGTEKKIKCRLTITWKVNDFVNLLIKRTQWKNITKLVNKLKSWLAISLIHNSKLSRRA